MDPGKERFFRNYIAIKRFALNGDIPTVNFWDFMNGIADLFYNFRREKLVVLVKNNSPTFKQFMHKNVGLQKRGKLFRAIKTAIRGVLIHLLNEKILTL